MVVGIKGFKILKLEEDDIIEWSSNILYFENWVNYKFIHYGADWSNISKSSPISLLFLLLNM